MDIQEQKGQESKAPLKKINPTKNRNPIAKPSQTKVSKRKSNPALNISLFVGF
jgi:hypothetical protein